MRYGNFVFFNGSKFFHLLIRSTQLTPYCTVNILELFFNKWKFHISATPKSVSMKFDVCVVFLFKMFSVYYHTRAFSTHLWSTYMFEGSTHKALLTRVDLKSVRLIHSSSWRCLVRRLVYRCMNYSFWFGGVVPTHTTEGGVKCYSCHLVFSKWYR